MPCVNKSARVTQSVKSVITELCVCVYFFFFFFFKYYLKLNIFHNSDDFILELVARHGMAVICVNKAQFFYNVYTSLRAVICCVFSPSFSLAPAPPFYVISAFFSSSISSFYTQDQIFQLRYDQLRAWRGFFFTVFVVVGVVDDLFVCLEHKMEMKKL